MRSNIAKVISAFEQGRAAAGDSKKTCSTDGHKVWSYAMLIAYRDEAGVHIADYASAPSATTRTQVRALLDRFPQSLTFSGTPTIASRNRVKAVR